MIVDTIENLSNYVQIPKDVVGFLQNLDSDVALGRYELSNGNYVNIETYQTKQLPEAKYEAHKNFIDIQMLLSGEEKIYIINFAGLTEFQPYNPEKDIVFFSDPIYSDYVTLDGRNFVMIYPHEAHAPQCSLDTKNCEVKKVVAKIKI